MFRTQRRRDAEFLLLLNTDYTNVCCTNAAGRWRTNNDKFRMKTGILQELTLLLY